MIEIIKYLVLPSKLVFLFLFLGGILYFQHQTKRLARILIAAAAILYTVFGTAPVSNLLLGNLENRYQPIDPASADVQFEAIVVLAAHGKRMPGLPLTSSLNSFSIYRLVEAARIMQRFPDKHLILTGHEEIPLLMKQMAAALGIQPHRIAVENKSTNTYESAVHLKRLIRENRFLLITSAGHMPRAMGVFSASGLNPIPLPTHYLGRSRTRLSGYIPTPEYLMRSDLAVHEYLGIFWYHLTDRI